MGALHEKSLSVPLIPSNPQPMNTLKPYIAGIAVVFIWSGWITLSRFGVHTQLQPSDITMLRYWTAFILVSPAVFRYPWKRYTLFQYLVIGLGVGFPYTMLSFYGLKVINAAHAGVLVNGMLPVMGAVVAWLVFDQKIALHRYGAIGLIFLSNLIMTGNFSVSASQVTGMLLLITAALCYTFHMTGIRLWQVNWQDVLVIVPVVNVLIFTPLWFVFPSGIAIAKYHDMAVQAVYQGGVVNVIALMCVAYAIRQLGTIPVALFMSFVPVTTAVLAWIVLKESLSPWEIAGIIGCSLGLLWYAREPGRTMQSEKEI